MNKPVKRMVNGVLLLDKPIGMTSNGALQQVRRLFFAQKAGHTGVLDPLASGLLPICMGEATKFAQYLLDADKAYTATLKLGEATTTGDAEGEVIAHNHVAIDQNQFTQACQRFVGEISQVPPMFSALKHNGKPLYEYARKGIVIERPARDVIIKQIDVVAFHPPYATINVVCSKGTYIRTLSEDIAQSMHTFAYLTALRRTSSAGFTIEQSATLEQLMQCSNLERDALLLPCDVLVQHFARVDLDAIQSYKLRLGQKVAWITELNAHTPYRAYQEDGVFLGLVKYLSDWHSLAALRLMQTV